MPKQHDNKGQFTEQMKREFPLFTNGRYPDQDLLAIVIECMEEMEQVQVGGLRP